MPDSLSRSETNRAYLIPIWGRLLVPDIYTSLQPDPINQAALRIRIETIALPSKGA